MKTACLKELFLETDRKNEELRQKLRIKVFDITGRWMEIKREQNNLVLVYAETSNFETTSNIINTLEERMGCKLKIQSPFNGDFKLVFEEEGNLNE
jgi:hypothetical protein